MKTLVKKLISESDGQDLIEYALLTAIVAVGLTLFGPPVLAQMKTAYQNRSSTANSLWVTPPPTP